MANRRPEAKHEPEPPPVTVGTASRDARDAILSVLSQFDNLSKLRDALVKAGEAEEAAAQQQATLKVIESHIEQAKAQDAEWRAKLTQRKVEHDELIADLDAKVTKRRQECLDMVDAAEKDRQLRLDTLHAEVEKATSSHADRLKALESEIANKQRSLVALNSQILDVRGQLENLKRKFVEAP